MELVKQIQGISYSLVFGFVFTFIYSFINRLFYKYHKGLFRLILQVIIGIVFGVLYYLGLLVINNGIVRIYFIIALLTGYVLYLNYYSYYMFILIEIMVKVIKYLLRPIIFIFTKISGIIRRMRRVVVWLKEKFIKPSKDLPV